MSTVSLSSSAFGALVCLIVSGCTLVSRDQGSPSVLPPGKGVLLVSIDTDQPIKFLHLRDVHSGRDDAVLADIPAGHTVKTVLMPAGDYEWYRVDWSDELFLYNHDLYPGAQDYGGVLWKWTTLNDQGWDMRFSVKAGVVNYPGTLIGTAASTKEMAVVVPEVNERGIYVEPLLSYHFASSDRLTLEMAGAEQRIRQRVAALGIRYAGPGQDAFPASLTGLQPISAAPAATTKSKADTETMDQFFKQGRYSRAALNPDGRQVLAVERRKGFSSQLVLIDLVTRSISDVTESADDEPFAGLQWLSDDTAIFFSAGTFSGQSLTAVRWRRSRDGVSDPRLKRWEGEYWIAEHPAALGRIKLGSLYNGSVDPQPCLFTAEPDAGPDILKFSDCEPVQDPNAPDGIRDDPATPTGVDTDGLRRAFPGQTVVPVGKSLDGKTVLVFVYDGDSAGIYYSFDTVSGQAKPLGSGKTEVIAETKAGSVEGPDENQVSYHLTLPPLADKPYPLVVMPDREESTLAEAHGFDSEVQFLARHGYGVLKIHYTDGGAKDSRSAESVSAVVRSVLRDQPLDAGRMCIYGVGVDGYVALMSAIHDPDLYRCVASLSAVTDIPVLYDVSNLYLGLSVRRSMETVTGIAASAVGAQHDVSPDYLAGKLREPVLLAAGENPKVDEEQAFRLKTALGKSGRQVEYVSYQGHDALHAREAQEDFYARLLEFLDQNIGQGTRQGAQKK